MKKVSEEKIKVAISRNGTQQRYGQLRRIQNWPELAQQANWSVTRLAKLCGVSTRAIQRHFRENHRKPPKAWLLEERQNLAVELMREGSSSIKEIAFELGYQHGHHFSRQFKKHWGYAPAAGRAIRGA